MNDKNNFNQNDKGNENIPLEIPDNTPSQEPKTIKAMGNDEKQKKTMKKVKAAYAFALILALGAAFTAKIATERALGQLKVPIESDYITTQPQKTTSKDSEFLSTEPDYEVRQNLTDVPDTREETTEETQKPTEATTEKGSYAVPYEDYYVLPMGTQIHKDYSPETPTYNATMGDWRTHNGIDFKGAEGDQVKAIANGKVINVYEDVLLGTVVEIDHGNELTAKYSGLNADTIEVKKGASVKGGTLIGYLGVVPCEKTDISHLHFEAIYKGKNVDPLEIMGK